MSLSQPQIDELSRSVARDVNANTLMDLYSNPAVNTAINAAAELLVHEMLDESGFTEYMRVVPEGVDS